MLHPDALQALRNHADVCVLGSAVVDVIADTGLLPQRGSDIELHQQGVNAGGCALNVAITLHRLEIAAVNALPLGQGVWASIIRQKLQEYGIQSICETDKGDNGWCLALVEPDGERTFLSVTGVEDKWDEAMLAAIPLKENGWLYLSGYQLTSRCADRLIHWLENLPVKQRLLIDFGPRLAHLDQQHWKRVMTLKPLITVNRQEAALLWQDRLDQNMPFDVKALMDLWSGRFSSPLVVRLDSEGAGFVQRENRGWVDALKTEMVDSVGAGDSHAGGLLAGLAAGWSLCDSVALGNAVASFVVSHRGGDCAPARAVLREHWLQRLTPQ